MDLALRCRVERHLFLTRRSVTACLVALLSAGADLFIGPGQLVELEIGQIFYIDHSVFGFVYRVGLRDPRSQKRDLGHPSIFSSIFLPRDETLAGFLFRDLGAFFACL